jgi:hypothetical protein
MLLGFCELKLNVKVERNGGHPDQDVSHWLQKKKKKKVLLPATSDLVLEAKPEIKIFLEMSGWLEDTSRKSSRNGGWIRKTLATMFIRNPTVIQR